MLSAIRSRGKTAHEALLDIWESEYENEVEERVDDRNEVETNIHETNRGRQEIMGKCLLGNTG